MARYRGRHRAPSPTGRTLARTAIAGAVLATPVVVAPAASAAGSSTVWDRLAQCESSGNWSINSGNGFSGGLQFTSRTWRGFGGVGRAHHASREQQIVVAERVLAKQGWGAWPACSRKLGLRGTPDPIRPAPHAKPSTAASAVKPAVKPAAGSGSGTLRVGPGDTLSRLAAAHDVPGGWQALRAANPGLANPHVLKIGTLLQMP